MKRNANFQKQFSFVVRIFTVPFPNGHDLISEVVFDNALTISRATYNTKIQRKLVNHMRDVS